MTVKTLPLEGCRILLTRPASVDGAENGEISQDALEIGLMSAGAKILSWPLIETVCAPFEMPDNLWEIYQGLLFTSKVGARCFLSRIASENNIPPSLDNKITWYAVGSKTADTIQGMLKKPISIKIPTKFDVLSAVQEWVETSALKAGDKILWPSGDLAAPFLPTWLAQYGVELTPLTVYQTRAITFGDEEKANFSLVAKSADCLVFTSPSAIEVFQELNGAPSESSRIACFGASTANKARALWQRADIVPEANTLESLAKSIILHYANHQ